MDCGMIGASIILCLLPHIIVTEDINRHTGKGKNVEISSEDIVYYSEEDIHRLVRQTTVFNNRPITPVAPYAGQASAVRSEQVQKNKQNAIVYPEPSANAFGQRINAVQRPAVYPFHYQGVTNPLPTAATPLIKVPIKKNDGTLLVRPLQNEVLPTPNQIQPDNGVPPQTQPPLPLTSDFDKSSVAMANFALNLMEAAKKANGQAGNIVVSPYSIATTLALLQQGAYGVTQMQISHALQMSPENSATVFRRYIDTIRKRASRNILKVATNVFIAPSFILNPAFKSSAINDFGSDVTPLDFNRPELAAQTINNWVAPRTDYKIDKLVNPDSIGQNSQLVLANAVYFKGIWQTTFNLQATETKNFTKSDGLKKPIPYMKMRRQFKTGNDFTIKSQVLILPFEGELYSLMMILPSEKVKLDDVVQSLQGTQLLAYHNFPVKEVQIEIPKFSIRADTDLTPVLQEMGVTNIFDENSELFGIGNYKNFSALVSSAKHSALLSIDEKGGSAAAATAFAVVALSYEDPSDYFIAIRPFLAVLWNEELAAPMFMAKIEDPTL